jgi:hypothetical protein
MPLSANQSKALKKLLKNTASATGVGGNAKNGIVHDRSWKRNYLPGLKSSGDSHTSTHGALSYCWIGTDGEMVLLHMYHAAKPKKMRINVAGDLHWSYTKRRCALYHIKSLPQVPQVILWNTGKVFWKYEKVEWPFVTWVSKCGARRMIAPDRNYFRLLRRSPIQKEMLGKQQ